MAPALHFISYLTSPYSLALDHIRSSYGPWSCPQKACCSLCLERSPCCSLLNLDSSFRSPLSIARRKFFLISQYMWDSSDTCSRRTMLPLLHVITCPSVSVWFLWIVNFVKAGAPSVFNLHFTPGPICLEWIHEWIKKKRKLLSHTELFAFPHYL